MANSTNTNSKNITLISDFEEMEKLDSFVEELQKWAEFSDEEKARVMLVLSEAATNAIVHGNQEDPDKKVDITATLSEDTLSITVKDEGEGFNPENLPDPLKEENLLKEGGRGVYLIKQYADDLTFHENGTSLTADFEF